MPGAGTGLTTPREPDQWTLPAWLAGPPAAVFLVAVGLAGCILSWWWASDSYAASIMTERLIDRRSDRPARAASRTVAPPTARGPARPRSTWLTGRSSEP